MGVKGERRVRSCKASWEKEYETFWPYPYVVKAMTSSNDVSEFHEHVKLTRDIGQGIFISRRIDTIHCGRDSTRSKPKIYMTMYYTSLESPMIVHSDSVI